MGTLTTTRALLLGSLAALLSFGAANATATQTPQQTVSGEYLVAQAAERSGDWKLASTLLTSLWHRTHDTTILRQAFLISLGAGNMDEAIRLSADLKPDMPESAVASALLVADAIKKNDLAGASKLLTTLPDRGISVPLKTILGAWLDAAHGNRTAIKSLDGLKQFDTYRLVHTAMIDEFLGDRTKADATYDQLNKDDPQPRIVSILAEYYRRTGRPERAAAVIAQLPAKGNIASISVRVGEVSNRPKPTVASGSAEAFYNMAELLLEADHPDIGLFYAAIAEHLDPGKPDTHLLMGEIEQAEGRHAQAAADFLAVPEKADFGLLARLDAVLALEEAGHINKAIAIAEDLVKARPTMAEPQMELGDLLRRHDQNAKAIDAYGHALTMLKQDDPLRGDIIFARAIAYDQMHNDKAAEADLQQAVSLSPDRPTVLNYLGFFWASRDENLQQAHDLLDHAYQLSPTDGAIADSLGWVLYQMGDYAGAIERLEQAVALRPGDSEINGHLGDAYWQVGRVSDARFQWRHALVNASGPAIDAFKIKLHDGMAEKQPKPPAPENHAEIDVKQSDQ